MSEKFINPGRKPEKISQYRLQTLCVARLCCEAPGEMKLCPIRHRVPILQDIDSHTKETSEVVGIPGVVGSVEIDAFRIACPRSKEKREHPMMEDIQEPRKGRIMRIPEPVSGKIG